MHLCSRGAMRPRFAFSFRPLPIRGRREDRVRAAPAVSCAKSHKKCAHEHTGPAESIRPSLRNGFTAYAALTSATNSSCHRHRRIKVLSKPGWARKTSTDLTSATDARSTRFCRTLQRRSSACRRSLTSKPALRSRFTPDAAASTASRSNVPDVRETPL